MRLSTASTMRRQPSRITGAVHFATSCSQRRTASRLAAIWAL